MKHRQELLAKRSRFVAYLNSKITINRIVTKADIQVLTFVITCIIGVKPIITSRDLVQHDLIYRCTNFLIRELNIKTHLTGEFDPKLDIQQHKIVYYS